MFSQRTLTMFTRIVLQYMFTSSKTYVYDSMLKLIFYLPPKHVQCIRVSLYVVRINSKFSDAGSVNNSIFCVNSLLTRPRTYGWHVLRAGVCPNLLRAMGYQFI